MGGVSQAKTASRKEKFRTVNFCLPQPHSPAPHDRKRAPGLALRGTRTDGGIRTRFGPQNRINKRWNICMARRHQFARTDPRRASCNRGARTAARSRDILENSSPQPHTELGAKSTYPSPPAEPKSCRARCPRSATPSPRYSPTHARAVSRGSATPCLALRVATRPTRRPCRCRPPCRRPCGRRRSPRPRHT